jgi:hypothetical protein
LDFTETILESTETISDLVGTVPSLINHHTMFPNIIKPSRASRSLRCVTRWFENATDITENSLR